MAKGSQITPIKYSKYEDGALLSLACLVKDLANPPDFSDAYRDLEWQRESHGYSQTSRIGRGFARGTKACEKGTK